MHGERRLRFPQRLLLILLAVLVVAGCTALAAQPPEKPRLGVLVVGPARLEKVEGLRDGLARLGYPASRLEIQVADAGGNRDRLLPVAQELLAAEPDVLVAGGGIESVILQELTRDRPIPVVMAGIAAPVETGIVPDARRPGGNITGVVNAHSQLAGKRLEMFSKLIPDLRRVLVVVDPGVVPGLTGLEVTRKTAAALGIDVTPLEVRRAEELAPALDQVPVGRYDGILVLPSHVLEDGAPAIGRASHRLGIPAMGLYPQDLEAGFLAIYGSSFYDQGFQAARLVAKVLRGEDPGAIPLETPDVPELVVNPAVARELGLNLNPVGLAFAQMEEVEEP